MFDFYKEKLYRRWDRSAASVLGIDVSPNLITLIEMSQSGEGYIVERFANEIFPRDSLGETVANLVKRSESSCRRVVITLASPFVVTRHVKLNENQSLEDIEDEIALIFDQIIPFPLEESYYDYLIEQEVSLETRSKPMTSNKRRDQSAKGEQEILIAASLREKIQEWIEAFAAIRLEVVMVTPSSLNMQRALHFILEQLSEPVITNEIIAMLDLRDANVTFYLFQNNRLFLTRELSKSFDINNQESKQFLYDQIGSFLKNGLTGLDNPQITHLILTGQSSLLNQVKIDITEKLGMVTMIANPLAKIQFAPMLPIADQKTILDQGSLLMPILGLLLSTFDTQQGFESSRKINLLPWREKQRKTQNKRFFLMLGFVMVLSAIFGVGTEGLLYYQKKQTEVNIVYLLGLKQRFSEKLTELEKLEQDKKRLFNHMEVIKALQQDRSRWLNFFDALPRLLPEGVYLNALVAKDEAVTLEGNARTHASVAAVLKELGEYQGPCFFEEIKLTEITTNKHELGLKFNIQLKLKTKR